MNEQDKNLCEDVRNAGGHATPTEVALVRAIERLSGYLESCANKLELAEACLAADGALITGLRAELAALKIELSKTKDALFLSDALVQELRALKAQGEPVVAWLYEFDGYVDALMPDEIEQDNFKEHPEMYKPLYLHPPVSIPEGWQLVPKEPTSEMIASADAADEEYTKRNFGNISRQQCGSYDHYKSMLAAAPKPPVVSEDAKDAARYRWLREEGPMNFWLNHGQDITCAEELDAAIDKAIGEGK